MKALKITVSGSYKTANGEIIDFEDVTGVTPHVDDQHAKMHVRDRYASEWVRDAMDGDKKLYPQRIDIMRQVFIDDIEEIEHDFDYVGKDIKKMTYEDLQDLATVKDLRVIPLPKKISGVDIREMRTKAYLEYSAKVNGRVIDTNNPEPEFSSKVGDRLQFDFAKCPAIIVGDAESRVETSQKITNDDILNAEMKNRDLSDKSLKTSLSMDEMKAMAKEKGITHHWNIGEDKLYSLLFG
tara:strand:- start:11461 stop:12177 length:717 start_codon:yes stop_codon:yes gene_type:complete